VGGFRANVPSFASDNKPKVMEVFHAHGDDIATQADLYKRVIAELFARLQIQPFENI